MTAEQTVKIVLKSLAEDAIDSTVVFSKSRFISRYYSLLRKQQVPRVKIETLLRELRRQASCSEYLKYYPGKPGWYILDTVALRL